MYLNVTDTRTNGQTDRQTDRQTTYNLITALFEHRAVKTMRHTELEQLSVFGLFE